MGSEALTKTRVYKHLFPQCQTELLNIGKLKVFGFRYASGVHALRVQNERGEIIVLPFHGQKVWDATFDGRRLKMRTPVKEPKPTTDFLANMGGFLFHCGMTAIGSPGPEDSHPIHGELVNAPYDCATIEAGADKMGKFIGISGEYEHSAAFGAHYIAQPHLRLYENDTLIQFKMQVKNLNNTPMEYMYLAHINFLPVDHGKFIYSAPYDKSHIHLRQSFPSHTKPTKALRDFVSDLEDDPTIHHVLNPKFVFDPEIVFIIEYESDPEGWAHSMFFHPDGSADYVSHRPDQLDHGIRWISRTPDQQGLGMEIGTAGVEGFTEEKKKGNVRILEPGAEFFCEYKAGLLEKIVADDLRNTIDIQMNRV